MKFQFQNISRLQTMQAMRRDTALGKLNVAKELRRTGTDSEFPWPIYQFTSKYSQRMRKLSCKIFNDFYVPELNDKRDLAFGHYHEPVRQWSVNWHSDLRVFERNQNRPIDLNNNKNMNYYPAHPQFRLLTHQLREYGLFRDEHRDFNEEMKAIAISRGKVFRERRGPITKTAKKK